MDHWNSEVPVMLFSCDPKHQCDYSFRLGMSDCLYLLTFN